MRSLCSKEKFNTEFGRLTSDAITVFTKEYPFLTIDDTGVYFKFDLESLFNEHIELFSVDPSLTSDIFIVNNLFGDDTIDPELILILTDIIQDSFDSDPINEDGYFWLTFTELRSWYGDDQFDVDMEKLFPDDYTAFKDYFLE